MEVFNTDDAQTGRCHNCGFLTRVRCVDTRLTMSGLPMGELVKRDLCELCIDFMSAGEPNITLRLKLRAWNELMYHLSAINESVRALINAVKERKHDR